MPTQVEWRFCQKCNAMFYNGLPQKFVCTGNRTTTALVGHGGHEAQGFVFDLPYDQPETPNVQTGWRQCGKCGVLFWQGAQPSVCIAGGAHEPAGNNFALPHDVPETDSMQAAWRPCSKCGAMFYDGIPSKGQCSGNFTGNLLHGFVSYGGHTPAGFGFVLPHPVPPVPDGVPPIDVQFTGPVWLVSLTHTQCEALEGLLSTSGALLTAQVVSKVLSALAGMIQTIDAIGGDQGVDVQGVLGVAGVIVTPHGQGMLGQLIAGTSHGITAAWIVDYLLLTAHAEPAVGAALGITTAASVLAAVMGGISVGVALATALGIDLSHIGSSPDPNEHGGIHADRPKAQEWEMFILSQLGPNNQVALLSWQGLFSAQNGGGADVYANRPQLRRSRMQTTRSASRLTTASTS
jgi:hypothetical protein